TTRCIVTMLYRERERVGGERERERERESSDKINLQNEEYM
uniref:Uncharacterized protein n=1 Tax=Amphimedon queenslandica TaxID=400682 RepID=A0A1X7T3A9_AMPQE